MFAILALFSLAPAIAFLYFCLCEMFNKEAQTSKWFSQKAPNNPRARPQPESWLAVIPPVIGLVSRRI